MIIHINGIQGSGKTYLCSLLKKNKNVICIDTDDVGHMAYKLTRHKYKPRIKNPLDNYFNLYGKTIRKLRDNIIKQHKDKILIFVGMTLTIHKLDYKYFIKLNDIKQTYRRFVKREFTKIFKHKSIINKIINKSDVNILGYDLRVNAGIAWSQPCEYFEYIREYKKLLKTAKKEKYTILPQKQIAYKINKIIKQYK